MSAVATPRRGQRLSDRDRYYRSFSEATFQGKVINLARAHGWLVNHQRPALNRSGHFSTAIQGAPGFPDLVLARSTNGEGRVIFAELKTETGKLTDGQVVWVKALTGHLGLEVHVWRPSDWDEIERVLA